MSGQDQMWDLTGRTAVITGVSQGSEPSASGFTSTPTQA
jgi:hypothetical protein